MGEDFPRGGQKVLSVLELRNLAQQAENDALLEVCALLPF
jgi:hypothetical protein